MQKCLSPFIPYSLPLLQMNYIYISILSLFLLGCSVDHENETKKTINWEEELFGVGLYGTHPDSLDQVWYSFPINKNAVEPIERHPISQYKTPYIIKGDTLKMYNQFFYEYLKITNRREQEAAVLIKRDSVMEDSSSFILSRLDSSYFKLKKIKGHTLVPEELFIQLSSLQLDPKFEHLEVRTGFASAPTDIHLSVYPDTAFLIMNCFNCDTLPERTVAQLEEDEIEFVHSFIKTLIKMRKKGHRSDYACTLGYGYKMTLAYDSLMYEYDNLSIFPVVPDILHQYLSNTIDITRFTPFPKDIYEHNYLYILERYRRHIRYYRGNNLVDTIPQELPSDEELKLPEPREENPVEVPPVMLSDSLQ